MIGKSILRIASGASGLMVPARSRMIAPQRSVCRRLRLMFFFSEPPEGRCICSRFENLECYHERHDLSNRV